MHNENYKILNPDHVELEFQLAGIGSRLYAGILDIIFMSLALLIALMAIVPLKAVFVEPKSFFSSFQAALLILIVFAVNWGYHVLCETFLQGQSLGKKLCRIQVLSDDGLLPTWKQVFIRNLIRIVDSFPGIAYVAAAIVMGIDSNGKRLGDIAAGTIVVRKEKKHSIQLPSLSARSMAQIESGKKAQALRLPYGPVDEKTVELIRRFLSRRHELTEQKRSEIALKIASPLYGKWGEKVEDPETFLEMIQKLAIEEAHKAVNEEVTKEKLKGWKKFETEASKLLTRNSLLRKLSPNDMDSFLRSYREIVADLARARSMNTDRDTLIYLNRLVILGHQLLYRNLEATKAKQPSFFFRFPQSIRKKIGCVMVSALFFFIPAIISYAAVWNHPELGYDLVPDAFLDFAPAQSDNIHKIPSLTRPIAASGIMTNNIQISFLAFALGITAGLGTCYVLIYNGIHLGSMAAWMQLHGHAYALWGWVMPHGATEILAIILSGAAGFILGDAILRPGDLSRKEAVMKAVKSALIIEIGCVGMLIIAGLIEGFISPSSLTYPSRVAICAGSILFWILYITFAKVNKNT